MSFWSIIKTLDFKQIWILFLWFLQHPLFMIATVKATFSTVRIAQKEFPDIHNEHNKANAFRHALWNVLIAKESAEFSKDLEEILNWTKTITDWHEEFSPNKEMSKLMDLHNNKFGRNKFSEVKNQSRNHIIKILKNELQNAIQIIQKSDFKNFENQLVYLED
jgi:3-polyprenyl-4-hydroxybenzoate decarboxylase